MATTKVPLDEVVHTETHWRARCTSCGSLAEKPKGPAHQDDPWTHVDPAARLHPVAPEIRAAIDATCPDCDFPEVSFVFDECEFACSRCGWHGADRPAA